MKAILRFGIVGDAIKVAETLLLNGYQVAIRQTKVEVSLGTWEVEVSKDESSIPKGHGRLIDVDALEKKVEKHRKMLKISEYDRDLILHYTDVEMAPTVIEADTGEME